MSAFAVISEAFPLFHGSAYELHFLYSLCLCVIIIGVTVFITLVFARTAPYGRYSSESTAWIWVPARLSWVLQECPMLVWAAICYPLADKQVFAAAPNCVLFSLVVIHYINRTFVYPLRTRGGKPSPLYVTMLAMLWNVFNGYMQLRYLTAFAHYPENYQRSPVFLGGLALFFLGMGINVHADSVLLNLRQPGETDYKIPHGGMFEFVSGANFFGEIVEWTGFAIASQSLPAMSFAFFTFCNIGPRGIQHHQWYLKKFEGYPKSRRGVIPFLW